MTDTSYSLNFITQKNFESHVLNTLKEYKKTLGSINLTKFTSNIVDPIKLLFDKTVYQKSFEEIVCLELQRQRDKSNNNSIGYFHQNLFKYVKNCDVPAKGWDVIFKGKNNTYYVEMKNKHNTMNSSSSAKTYMKFQNHLLTASDKDTSVCALVEVISKKSQDIAWVVTIDEQKQTANQRLRRISIDKFYEIVTGNKNAFKELCYQLPITLQNLTENNSSYLVEKDTVLQELKEIDNDILVALYKLAFNTYEGFDF